jgi:hypothetical protein
MLVAQFITTKALNFSLSCSDRYHGDPIIGYIEDNPSASFLTQRHNCDVSKDSDQSNHMIVNLC